GAAAGHRAAQRRRATRPDREPRPAARQIERRPGAPHRGEARRGETRGALKQANSENATAIRKGTHPCLSKQQHSPPTTPSATGKTCPTSSTASIPPTRRS